MYARQAVAAVSLAGFLIFTVACSLHATTAEDDIRETHTASPVPSPVSSATAQPASPTPGCMDRQGRLKAQEIVSAFMPAPLRFIVYLPPCFDAHSESVYPVLYLFHGQFYDETQWAQLGIQAVADRLIAAGDSAPFLIVLPFDPYPYQPYEYGFDEAFIRDLLPYVESQYRGIASREQRALGGISRGSSWALHFGLSRPELFGRFGMHSPVVFATDGLLVEKWLDIIPPERMPQVYLDVSENDQNLVNVIWLEDTLTERAIPHEWHLNTGFHMDEYWALHIEEYLRWYTSDWDFDPQ